MAQLTFTEAIEVTEELANYVAARRTELDFVCDVGAQILIESDRVEIIRVL